jgi:hypothetical protein
MRRRWRIAFGFSFVTSRRLRDGGPVFRILNMKNKRILAFAVLSAASIPSVFACDLCAIYSATEAQGSGKGFYAGVAEQFTYFGTLQIDGQQVPADGEYINSSVSQIFFGYNFNDRFGLQFNMPLIYRDYGSATAYGSEFGIGDASLVGNVVLLNKSVDNFTFHWTALGGVKFPTGNPFWLGQPDFAPGIGGHDLALGSGSYDGLVGTGFSIRHGRWFLDGEMQYAIRSEGAFEHRYANDWTWAGGPGVYLLLNDNYTIAAQAAVSGESKGMDTFNGVPDEDSAETIVYLGPEVRLTWSENLSAHVGADLPVSVENSGEQLMPNYRIHAALTWRF